MGNITNNDHLEIFRQFVKRVTIHWINWLQYQGRACRDKQVCKARDLVFKGFNKRYAKKM